MNEAAYQAILNRLGLERSSIAIPLSPDWLAECQMLARLTDGITREDPRFEPVLAALSQCDDFYLANDWPAFQQAAARLRQTVTGEEVHGR